LLLILVIILSGVSMIFTVKDERTGSQVKFFLGETLEDTNKATIKWLKLKDTDLHNPAEEKMFEGVSYLRNGRAIVWLHKKIAEHPVKLYTTLLHELLHVSFHFNDYWEDDSEPEQYDHAIKSEAHFIDFTESLFKKVFTKILNQIKKQQNHVES